MVEKNVRMPLELHLYKFKYVLARSIEENLLLVFQLHVLSCPPLCPESVINHWSIGLRILYILTYIVINYGFFGRFV